MDRGPILVDQGAVISTCNDVVLSSIEVVDPSSFASNTVSTSDRPCIGASPLFGPAPLAIGALGANMYAMSNPAGGNIRLVKVKLTAPNNGHFSEVFGLSLY